MPSAELCDKAFASHNAFSAGIYSIGFDFNMLIIYLIMLNTF